MPQETWLSVLSSPVLAVFSILDLIIVLFHFCFENLRDIAAELSPLLSETNAQNERDAQLKPYTDIEPQMGLDLQTEEPLQLRPFRAKYHLTMALENTTFSEFLLMDKTYRSRIQFRRDILESDEYDVVACNLKGNDAVFELYRWLTVTYLPCRFPNHFKLNNGEKAFSPALLLSEITGERIPLQPYSSLAALKILGAHIDTEFLLLLPNPITGNYHLEAFVNCTPSGFNTRAKLSLPLAAIHIPVPGYKQKLEKSMDRFFASLPNGKIVKRANWSITTNRELFSLDGNHGHVGLDHLTQSNLEFNADETAKRDRSPSEESDFSIDDCVLRCERQTLHRLPVTGALVFAFKTYQYELLDVRQEGNGEALTQAIDGLKEGSVPSMNVYKRGAVWGEKVKEFLRS